MPYYFVGGEDSDFQKLGNVLVGTNTVLRRPTYSRVSLVTNGGIATDGWIATLSSTVTSFWFSARFYPFGSTGVTTYDLLAFFDGSVRRLMLGVDGTSPNKIRIFKQDAAGTRTTLATSTLTFSNSGPLFKLDVQVINYGAAGTVNVYMDGVLWVTYTGDITTNGATSLSGFILGHYSASSYSSWSEIICSSADTRSEGLVTLHPAANGNAWAWSGSYANVDEATVDENDIATSTVAGDIAQATVSSSLLTGNPAVHAVVVAARAQKGTTGPANIDLGVRVAATNYWSADIALPVFYGPVRNVWETNPNTAATWVVGDLTAAGFNIGMKSVA